MGTMPILLLISGSETESSQLESTTLSTSHQCTYMQEESQSFALSSCCCFLAGYLALAGLYLLAQVSDRIHHFAALNSENLVRKANDIRL